jgi:hypothetical protein
MQVIGLTDPANLANHRVLGRTGAFRGRRASNSVESDLLYGRSVAPGFIESVIGEGRSVTQSNGNIWYTSGSVEVILSPEGRVVTVITQH